MPAAPPSSPREQICEAAVRLAARDGLLAMTIDNVAREAGVSKGGVMHHFRSKAELVSGMLCYFGERAERMLVDRVASDPSPRNRWGRAFVDCVFPPPEEDDPSWRAISPEVFQRFLVASLAAAVNSPETLAPLRELAERIRDRILAEGEDSLDQILCWLAIDGLFLWQMLGLVQPGDALFEQIGQRLRERLPGGRTAPPRGGP